MLLALPPLLPPHLRERLIDRLLRLAAGLPLMIVAALVAALLQVGSAGAADETCPGNDIVAELQTKDPTALKALQEKAAAVPNGDAVFWRVEKKGLAPSFLLGTMHLTDPRVLTLPPAAEAARAAAETIVIESDEILDEKKAALSVFTDPSLTSFTDGTTISSLLGPEESAKLAEGLKARGLALPLVERMKPWMIASFVSLPPCEFARKARGVSFLDKKIAEDALAAGKTVKGLETLKEQLTAMSEVPVSLHLKALSETLALGSRMDDSVETMIRLYGAGKIGMIMPVLESLSPDSGADDGYAAFEKRIILDRNRIMAERSAPLFARGGVFMAVGALHLPGAEGVVELLRREGYTVTAVR